jgi:4-amino-4-deoxy-L-arabinose transferase-like glycosyltransferase
MALSEKKDGYFITRIGSLYHTIGVLNLDPINNPRKRDQLNRRSLGGNMRGGTDRQLSKIFSQKTVMVFVLLGFCFVVYFLNLGQWDLWNPDEPRYAQVAREMVQGRDWILMHFNGRTYGDKPPLFFWLIALSSYLWQGFTSFSARFPSALFGTLGILITFLLGKKLFDPETGFLSGLILATSTEFAYLSTRANIDATLTFFTTASLLCFLQWYLWNQQDLDRKRNMGKLCIYGFYVGMALGTLTKGPVGFILPLLVSLIFLIVLKDWKTMKSMRLLSGMLLFLVIVLSWYLPAVLSGGKSYLQETLFKHTVKAYAEGWTHVRPIYYYLYHFPVDFLPWFLFLPAALAYGYSGETVQKKKEFLFLLIWFIVIFCFFSLSKGKRGLYLLPLFPAVSLIVGNLWKGFIFTPMNNFRREWVSFPLYGFMGLILFAGVAAPGVVYKKLPSYVAYSLPIAFLMVGSSVVLFFLYRRRKYGALFLFFVGVMGASFFYTERVVFPLINPFKSARFVSQEVKSLIQPGGKLCIYGGIGTGPYNFYSGIVPILELEKKEDLINLLNSSQKVFCILTFRDFSYLQTLLEPPKVRVIKRQGVGHNDIVLISNQ